jgi:hypothetical protein
MQWLNDFTDWFTSAAARPVIFAAVVLAIAIIVSGLLAAWIARGAVRSLVVSTERDRKAAAIATLVDAATEASVWNSLTPQEQVLSDRAVGQAETHVRLLPVRGAGIAADWAAHQLAAIKRSSATFGYQLEPAIAEFRERLVEWQNKPGRARRLFEADLERWRFETTDDERAKIAEQDSWVAKQHHERHSRGGESREAALPERPSVVTERIQPASGNAERETVSVNQGYAPIEPASAD